MKETKEICKMKKTRGRKHRDEWAIGYYGTERYMLEHPHELIQNMEVYDYLVREYNIECCPSVVSQAFGVLELFYNVYTVKGHGHIYVEGSDDCNKDKA